MKLLAIYIFSINFLLTAAFSSIDDGAYPLRGTWRSEFPRPYQDCHLEMAREELAASGQADREALRNDPNSFGINRALCSLKAYAQRDSTAALESIDVVDLRRRIFVSGGHIITDYGTMEFHPIVQDKLRLTELLRRKKESLTTLLSNFSKLSAGVDKPAEVLTKLDEGRATLEKGFAEYEELKRQATALAAAEDTYESECACKADGYKKQAYDSEQVIIRAVDHSLKSLTYTATEIVISGRNVPKASIQSFTLHLHSRFDMCLYCLQSLHLRAIEWNGLLRIQNVPPISVFVSSRQDFLSKSMHLYTLPGMDSRYVGTSMRSIGIDVRSTLPLEEGERRHFAEQGIIVQTVIPSSVLYVL